MKDVFLQHIAEILIFVTVFFASINVTILAIGFLILADTFTGIWGVVNTTGWSSFTSRKLSRIINKLIFYPLSIIVAKVFETYFLTPVPLVDVTAGILATIEVKSIYENISNILGFDLWSKIKKHIVKTKPDEPDEDIRESRFKPKA